MARVGVPFLKGIDHQLRNFLKREFYFYSSAPKKYLGQVTKANKKEKLGFSVAMKRDQSNPSEAK